MNQILMKQYFLNVTVPRVEERGGHYSTPRREYHVVEDSVLCPGVKSCKVLLMGETSFLKPSAPQAKPLVIMPGVSEEMTLKLKISERIRIIQVKCAPTTFFIAFQGD